MKPVDIIEKREENVVITKKQIKFLIPGMLNKPICGPIVIEEHGQTNPNYAKGTKYVSINLSSILCRLIKTAAYRCDYYCSDLFISWQSFEAAVKEPGFGTQIMLLGFRDSGVDGNEFIQSRLNNTSAYGSNPYSELYAVIATEDPEQTGSPTDYPEVYLVSLDPAYVKSAIAPMEKNT